MSQNQSGTSSSVFSGIFNKGVDASTFANGNAGIPIKVILDINIGGKSEKIPLTSSLLYIPPEEPSKLHQFVEAANFIQTTQNPTTPPPPTETIPNLPLETYPRIPMKNVLLPASELKNLRYKEVVQFFFNKTEFAKRMQIWNKGATGLSSVVGYIQSIAGIEGAETTTDTPVSPESERPGHLLSEREVENIQIEKENIELMLHLLFPTYAFHTEGYKTSMQYWNTREPYLINYFPKTQFSYIRHNGKIYTITNAVWLNDVFNVPFYRELIGYYERYKQFKSDLITKLENEKQNILLKKQRLQGNEIQLKDLDKEMKKIDEVVALLQKNIMSLKEYNELFGTDHNSRYYDIRTRYLVHLNSGEAKDYIYIYNIIYSEKKEHVLSNSNRRLNDIIYSEPIGNSNDRQTRKPEAATPNTNNKEKQLLEQMLENILDYANHNGNVSYLARGICSKEDEDKGNCNSSSEISMFYYTGMQQKNKPQTTEPSYEIYVLLDVIEGEVGRKNFARIKCSYDDQSIGKKIEQLTKQWPIWDLSNRRIFMRLDAPEEIPQVSKTITEYDSKSFIARSSAQSENRNINNEIQKRIEKWKEFDKTQTEHKLKNALEKLRSDISSAPSSNIDMKNVAKPNWSLDNGGYIENRDYEAFLKWQQNPNKYPPPSTSIESNDSYVNIDRTMYQLLERMEVLFQSKADKNSKIRDIDNIVASIDNLMHNIEGIIRMKETRMTSQWGYVKIIMNFYVALLSFLINFLEYKKRKYQQEGSNFSGGSGRRERNFYSLINKTMKKYEKLGKLTRKLRPV